MRLQPFQRQHPLAALLQGGAQVLESVNQRKMQEFMLRRQAEQEQYERQRQTGLDQERSADRLFSREQAEADRQQRMREQDASDIGRFDEYQNPAPLIDLARNTRRGVPSPARPPVTFGLPGPAAPGGPALPFNLPGADPTRAAFDQAGQRVQDVRNQADNTAAMERLKLTQQGLNQRATEHTNRSRMVAELNADAAMKRKQIDANTAAGKAYRDSYVKAFSEDYDASGDLARADQVGDAAAEQSLRGFGPRPGLTPAPPTPFPTEKIVTPNMMRAQTGAQNADTNAFRADETARKNAATEKLNAQKFEFDKQKFGKEYAEKAKHNRAQELHQAETRKRLAATPGETGKIARADEMELISIRDRVGRMEKEVNESRAAAQQKDPDALWRVKTGLDELKKLQARERAILDRYQVGTPPTVSVTPSGSGSFSPATRGLRQKAYQAFIKEQGREPSPAELKRIQGKIDRGEYTDELLDRALGRR